MKLVTFDYKKDSGETSKRILAVHAEPERLFKGTDISTLTASEVVDYMADLNALHSEYLKKINELNSSYDLNYQFRAFKPENMSNIVVDNM